MNILKFEKTKTLGVLSSSKNITYEFNIVKWNNGEEKYDIRRWGNLGDTPYKGCSFTKEEIKKIYNILKKVISMNKNMTPLHEVDFGKLNAKIYDILGEYKTTKNMKGLVTYTSWGSSPKYDLRLWDNDFTTCGKGVTLNDLECESFLRLCANEIDNVDKRNEEFDTSLIDDDLFL